MGYIALSNSIAVYKRKKHKFGQNIIKTLQNNNHSLIYKIRHLIQTAQPTNKAMESIFSDETNQIDDIQQANSKLQSAYKLLISNQHQQSIKAYKKIIQQHPTFWRAYQNLGVAYILIKEFQNAYQILKTYVKNVPNDALGHDSLGVTCSQLNDPLQAICSFVNATNLSPTYYMSYYNLGVVLGKIGLHEMAFGIYQKCLDINPNYVNALNNVGDIFKRFGKIDQAIAIFKAIIEMDPTYFLAFKNLGNCHLNKKQYGQALLNYIQLLQIPGNTVNQVLTNNITQCLTYLKMYQQAANVQKAFLTSQPDQIKNKPQKISAIALLHYQQMKKAFKILCYYLGTKKRRFPKVISGAMNQNYRECIQSFAKGLGDIQFVHTAIDNMRRIQFNFCKYLIRLGVNIDKSQILSNISHVRRFQQCKKVVKLQRKMVVQIQKWRKHTKTIVKMKRKIFSQEQQNNIRDRSQVYQKLNKKETPILNGLSYTNKKYISRVKNRNWRILIPKRYLFNRKYQAFNQKLEWFFPNVNVPFLNFLDDPQQQKS